jgi:hypothetical protein
MRTPLSGHRRRVAIAAALTAGAVLGVLTFAVGVRAAESKKPWMEVLPRATGLKYRQTVEVRGHNLPKGSGTVAATICGLENAQGKRIKTTADDCAGANEVGKLVILKSWQSNGEFATKYTLPSSGQTFGKNKRFCDKTHHCALVVADANPDNPAYYVSKNIQFVDQQPFNDGRTPTTKGRGSPTTKGGSGNRPTTTTASPGARGGATVDASGNTEDPGVHVDVTFDVVPPAGGSDGGDAPEVSVPPQAVAAFQAPGVLCIAGAPAWQNEEQVTAACNEVTSAVAPVAAPVGDAIGGGVAGS